MRKRQGTWGGRFHSLHAKQCVIGENGVLIFIFSAESPYSLIDKENDDKEIVIL